MPNKPQRKIRRLKTAKEKAEAKRDRLGVAIGTLKRRRDRNLRKYERTGKEKYANRASRAHRLMLEVRKRRRKVLDVIAHIVERLRFWRNRREKLENRRPNWNGHPPLQNKYLRAVVVRANRRGGYVTSTTGGRHSFNSWHYKSKAVDIGWTYDEWHEMEDFQRDEYRRGLGDGGYYELIGPSNSHNLSYGQQWVLREGDPTEQAHDNHNHHAHA